MKESGLQRSVYALGGLTAPAGCCHLVANSELREKRHNCSNEKHTENNVSSMFPGVCPPPREKLTVSIRLVDLDKAKITRCLAA
jgi:hypothetical protein